MEEEHKTRRSDRVRTAIALEIAGVENGQTAFVEKARTLVINRYGAAIIVNRMLQPDQPLSISYGEPRKRADFKVIRELGLHNEGLIYGVELQDTSAAFWDVEFPPLRLAEDAAGRVLLECGICESREVAYLGVLEAGVFEETRGVARRCRHCGKITDWGVPEFDSPFEEEESKPGSKSAPPEEKPVPEPPPAPKPRRIKVTLTACVRHPDLGEEVVLTQDARRGRISFLTRRSYSVGTRIEVAVPFVAGATNIFAPARIVRMGKRNDEGWIECLVAFIQSVELTPEADGSYTFIERTTRDLDGESFLEDPRWKQVTAWAPLGVAALALVIWGWHLFSRGQPPSATETTEQAGAVPAVSASEDAPPLQPGAPGSSPGLLAPNPPGHWMPVATGPAESAPAGGGSSALTLAYRQSDRGELLVLGQIRLPDGFALEIQIFSGTTLVARDVPVFVKSGRFRSRPLLQRGDPFASGTYGARVLPATHKSRAIAVSATGQTGPDDSAAFEHVENFTLN